MLEGSVVQVIKNNRVVDWISCENPLHAETEFVKFLEKYVKDSVDWDEDEIKKVILDGYYELKNGSITILDLDSDSEDAQELALLQK